MKTLCISKEIIVLIRVVVLLMQAQNQQSPTEGDSFQERYGDGVAWGGCTFVYLLGQETRFELLDFSYHVLAVAESDTLPTSLAYIEMMAKGTTSYSVVSNLTIVFQLHPCDGMHVLKSDTFLRASSWLV
jgi:hypothetical protein